MEFRKDFLLIFATDKKMMYAQAECFGKPGHPIQTGFVKSPGRPGAVYIKPGGLQTYPHVALAYQSVQKYLALLD